MTINSINTVNVLFEHCLEYEKFLTLLYLCI